MRPRQSSNAQPVQTRWPAYAIAALVVVAILFGGGGAEGPINNGLIQAFSAVLLALLFAAQIQGSWTLAKTAKGAIWLLLALLVIVLLQLVPLPPSVWQSLPGRDLAENTLALIGSSDEWRSHSLDPEATRRFAASLLLPSAIFFGLLGATRRETLLVVRMVVVAAGVSALIGALQLTLDTPAWLIYFEGPNPGAASGVFANANHHATLLAGTILCLALLIRAERPGASRGKGAAALLRNIHPGWLALPFFVVMTLATGSRAGVILLGLAIPGSLLIALGRRSPVLWLGGLAAVGLVVMVTILFSPSGNYLATGHNFVFSEDSRYSFLPDVLFTLKQYWPWGSGFGTFVQVFAPNENLDVASWGYVNHAHNDLLEWLIETGIVGAIWLATAVAVTLWRLVRVAQKRNELRGSQFAAVLTGALILLFLALHSMVDYPGRVAAISALAAVGAALIFSPMMDAAPRAVSVHGRPRWPLALAGVLGFIIGALALRLFAAEAAVREDQGARALQFRPHHGRALALAAEEQLKARNVAASRQLARAAIERAPLTPSAVRVLAMAAPNPPAAIAAWRVASALGWRDHPTQLWAFQQAVANGEWSLAAVRADALLRTRSRIPKQYLALVRTAAVDPRFRSALIERLALTPTWRAAFFYTEPDVSDHELRGAYEVLRMLATTGKKPTLGETRMVIMRLIERKQYEPAIDIYRQVRSHGTASAELLEDGSFDRPIEDYYGNSTPFDWLLAPGTGASATIEENNGRSLFMETDGTASQTLLRRYLPLDAGQYRLQYGRRGDAASGEAIGIAIRCVDGALLGSGPASAPADSGFEDRQIRFEVDPNCPVITINFEARAVGHAASAEFDDFSLRRTNGE